MFEWDPWKKRSGELRRRERLGGEETHPLARFREDFQQLIDRYFGELSHLPQTVLGGPCSWRFDVEETDDEMVVRADAPGFETGEFDIQVRGERLAVSAEHKEEAAGEEGAAWRSARLYRSVPLPPDVDPDAIRARYRNGILEIRIPKGEASRGKRVAVQGG